MHDAVHPTRPIAPPTRPGVTDAHIRRAWPMVFGILFIVLAALELLAALWGIVSLMLDDVWSAMIQSGNAAGGQPNTMTFSELMPASPAIMQVVNGITVIIAFVGLIGGITLLARRRLGVTLLIIYAWMEIVPHTGWAMYTVWQQMGLSSKLMAQNGNPGMPGPIMIMATVAGILFVILFKAAPALTYLLWLRRASVREDIGRWQSTTST